MPSTLQTLEITLTWTKSCRCSVEVHLWKNCPTLRAIVVNTTLSMQLSSRQALVTFQVCTPISYKTHLIAIFISFFTSA